MAMEWMTREDGANYRPVHNDTIEVCKSPKDYASTVQLRYCAPCSSWHPISNLPGWSPCALVFNPGHITTWRKLTA